MLGWRDSWGRQRQKETVKHILHTKNWVLKAFVVEGLPCGASNSFPFSRVLITEVQERKIPQIMRRWLFPVSNDEFKTDRIQCQARFAFHNSPPNLPIDISSGFPLYLKSIYMTMCGWAAVSHLSICIWRFLITSVNIEQKGVSWTLKQLYLIL